MMMMMRSETDITGFSVHLGVRFDSIFKTAMTETVL